VRSVAEEIVDVERCAGIVDRIVRGMRRRGLPGNVDPDDLRQTGLIASTMSGVFGPDALIAQVARNAMRDLLRAKRRESAVSTSMVTDSRGEVILPVTGGPDPFSRLPVNDYRSKKQQSAGALETLASRHSEWERERAERWA
jgi:hypothetical protein